MEKRKNDLKDSLSMGTSLLREESYEQERGSISQKTNTADNFLRRGTRGGQSGGKQSTSKATGESENLRTEEPLMTERMTESEMEALLNLKTKKLLNSKSFNNRMLIVRFIVMGSLFTVYFVFIFYFQTRFLRRVNFALSSAETLWNCPFSIKSTSMYTYESLIKKEVYKNVTKLRNSIYEESSKLDRIVQYDFPHEFTPFLEYMRNMRLNICRDSDFKIQDCKDNEYLVKGLKTIDVKIAENTRELIKMLENKQKIYDSAHKDDLINHEKVKLTLFLMKYSSKAYEKGLIIYKQNFLKFLKNYLFKSRLTNIVFCGFLGFVGVVILRTYVRSLSERILKTKGLLNMIPLSILEENEHLRYQIIHGKIFKAVR